MGGSGDRGLVAVRTSSKPHPVGSAVPCMPSPSGKKAKVTHPPPGRTVTGIPLPPRPAPSTPCAGQGGPPVPPTGPPCPRALRATVLAEGALPADVLEVARRLRSRAPGVRVVMEEHGLPGTIRPAGSAGFAVSGSGLQSRTQVIFPQECYFV